MNYNEITDKLVKTSDAADDELLALIGCDEKDKNEYLRAAADDIRQKVYGKAVYLRGLIEFTSVCRNDCLYCGLRRSDRGLSRYHLTEDEIFSCCRTGYDLGFRTFVLQGGEDPEYSDNDICGIVSGIKNKYSDCAVTLSIGEKSYESYEKYYQAGCDRYLLRHETADRDFYYKLHPAEMSFENRIKCLFNLKKIGYQVGAGFMVGPPGAKDEYLLEDLRFLQKLGPHMIGIGPFIAHHATPFKDEPNGSVGKTLQMLSILRLLFPHVLLPSTTALGTIDPLGRELGLQHGANVVMPNLSPVGVRSSYSLYDNKICTGEEAAECRNCLERRIKNAGYEVVTNRGDFPGFVRN